MTEHPAKFSAPIVEAITDILHDEYDLLGRAPLVLDPFAGVGGIEQAWPKTVGVELEPEWAVQGERVIVGDARNLPFARRSIDVIATSPCYGNRMADHHEAKDASKRYTYRHNLGRMPTDGSAAVMQWGDAYREFHQDAWHEAVGVLRPGGLFILNVGDHIRKFEQQKVSAWHAKELKRQGLVLERRIKIHTRKMKNGANRDSRIPFEWVITFRKGQK